MPPTSASSRFDPMYLLVLAPSEVPARGQDGGIRHGWCRQQGAQGLLWWRCGALWDGGAGEALGAQRGLCWGCAVLWGCSHMSRHSGTACLVPLSQHRAAGTPGATSSIRPDHASTWQGADSSTMSQAEGSAQSLGCPGMATAPVCPPHRCSPSIASPFLLGLGSCSPSDPKGTFVPRH